MILLLLGPHCTDGQLHAPSPISAAPRFAGRPRIIDYLLPTFNKAGPCRYSSKRDRGYHGIAGKDMACGAEIDEWHMVDALVTPAHTVLEFGARFGTTSCRLAHATNNSGNVVSVEPDEQAHPALLHNRESNRCNFHAVLGTVAMKQQSIIRGKMGYDHRTATPEELAAYKPAAHEQVLKVPSVTPREIERQIGSRINALLIDCEGCINRVFETKLPERVDLVLIEQDMWDVPPTFIHYGNYSKLLRELGFVRIWLAHDTFETTPASSQQGPEDSFRRLLREQMHSAWAKKGVTYPTDRNLCFEYKTRMRLADTWIKCASDEKGLETLSNGGR